MRAGPFLDDPRDLVLQHIMLAVVSPIEEVRAIHIRAAEHHAGIAEASGMALIPKGVARALAPRLRQRTV